MPTYTVPVEFTLRVRDEKKALDIVRDAIGLAIDLLLSEKTDDLVAVLDSTEYGNLTQSPIDHEKIHRFRRP